MTEGVQGNSTSDERCTTSKLGFQERTERMLDERKFFEHTLTIEDIRPFEGAVKC